MMISSTEKKKIGITKTQLYIICIIIDTIGFVTLKVTFNFIDLVAKSVFKGE